MMLPFDHLCFYVFLKLIFDLAVTKVVLILLYLRGIGLAMGMIWENSWINKLVKERITKEFIYADNQVYWQTVLIINI